MLYKKLGSDVYAGVCARVWVCVCTCVGVCARVCVMQVPPRIGERSIWNEDDGLANSVSIISLSLSLSLVLILSSCTACSTVAILHCLPINQPAC